jgi:hypothetical protein
MHRVPRKFALVYLAFSTTLTIGCMDQSRQDQALAAMENAQRESARDSRLQALEREHTFMMQQVAGLSAANQSLMAQTAAKQEELDRRLFEMSGQLATMSQTITALRQDEHVGPTDPSVPHPFDEDSNQARNAAIRKVQTLIDEGRVTITMRNGRIQLSPARLFDVRRPREPVPAKPAPATPVTIPPVTSPPVIPPPKRPIDRLGF